MPKTSQDAKLSAFHNMVAQTERVGISEFARSKDWRQRLPRAGCFEVVDRGSVVGYMLAPDYAASLDERITELEEELEKAQIAAMFNARCNYADFQTGDDLKSGALTYFDENADALMEIANDD